MIRILFVDDDPQVLAGYRRMMRRFRQEWHMEFVDGGAAALARLQEQPFDVVITDMRMPEMDGAELLGEVRRRYPATVRIILSGFSGPESTAHATGPAHQFLAKPCEPEAIRAALQQSLNLRQHLANPRLREVVTRISTLPSLPRVYRELVEELNGADQSVDRVGAIVAQDAGMTAKLLQLVNSSFFGVRQRVNDPVRATALLGLNLIRSLVLTIGVFSQYRGKDMRGFCLESMMAHSLQVGQLAHQLSREMSPDARVAEDAQLAGLLHDVGKLILATELPEVYGEIVGCQRRECRPLYKLEKETLGASHAEVGGHLLSLWALPDAVCEAVAFHHSPSASPLSQFGPLAAVHLANALVREEDGADTRPGRAPLDTEFLARLPIPDQLMNWCHASASGV